MMSGSEAGAADRAGIEEEVAPGPVSIPDWIGSSGRWVGAPRGVGGGPIGMDCWEAIWALAVP